MLIITEYYAPLYSAFEQVLLPGDTALYKCFLLLLLFIIITNDMWMVPEAHVVCRKCVSCGTLMDWILYL